jgi:sulfite exporter TauE/SafE/copper chaperone CopZ
MDSEFYVHGMHCAACEFLVEDKLSKYKGVKDVKADLKTCKVYVRSDTQIAPEELTKLVEGDGYKISNAPEALKKIDYQNLLTGLSIAVSVFIGFLLLQKLGIVNLINPKQVTLPFVFFIGVVASLSTCMAVVGGLVLSISSNFAKDKYYTPLIAFHLSRLIGFFVLGGVIGLLGSAFVLNNTAYFIMDILLFIVMVVMGLNLLDVFTFTKGFSIKMPKLFGKQIVKLQNRNGVIPAALTGVATFVLPCGFTQSMQVYSLTTGNFIQGAMTMLVFALGTLPVLSLISFASVKFQSKVFFTTAGFLVLMFAVFNLITGLSALGIA